VSNFIFSPASFFKQINTKLTTLDQLTYSTSVVVFHLTADRLLKPPQLNLTNIDFYRV